MTSPDSLPVYRLVVSCPDRPGIVSAISTFLAGEGANILTSDQFATEGGVGGTFFMRLTFHLDRPGDFGDALRGRFAAKVAERYGMQWRMVDAAVRKRVAVFVSRYDHTMLDLLWRWRSGELAIDIGCVVSNWEDCRADVEGFGLPYHHIPVTKDTKPQAEAAQLEIVAGNYDLVVMARYMQILSADFLERVGCPVINIHHSFLPAFAGAGPYERAFERGVKQIGATAHYATSDLDEGPIIEQDVIRVSHNDTAADLTRLGADIERTVLARAVRWHSEDRVLVDGNRTVVF